MLKFMLKLNCKNCKKVFESDRMRTYCCKWCCNRSYYSNNKEKMYKASKKWVDKNREKHNECMRRANTKYRKNNRDKFNKMVMDNYYKNKDKWKSRRTTLYIDVEHNFIKNVCYVCSSKKELEIHHDIYPIERDDIIKAINDEKIYKLCKSCHGKLRQF